MEPLRIGCLGAARIAPPALIKPCQSNDRVICAAVAARDPNRAREFATKHGINKVHGSYEALLADDEIDAVYNPLPNGLHGFWTQKALEHGKHVLCEKPFTANADEAQRVADATTASGLVVMEAFHWRYHPLAARMLEVIASGELGEIRRIEAALCFPLPRFKDIRWQLPLAGGALMDAGCYPVHMVRTLAGSEPTVQKASAKLHSAGVDRRMEAEFTFADGPSGGIVASMWSSSLLRMRVKVTGSEATMKVFNPVSPHMFNRLSISGSKRKRHERVQGAPTYNYQLEAFRAAVQEGAPTLTPPADAVANMRVIDAVYLAAGLEPRPAWSESQ
ncbi:MAG: Gfo/Idh/MocA family oxidoreductase [Acidimicrobiales bacterium]